MPAQNTGTLRPTAKRPRLEQARVFASVQDISSALRSENEEALAKDLTALRNQISLRPGEDSISPSDPRLLLVQHWLEQVPGAHDIFSIWDSLTKQQTSLSALIVSILSSLVTLTSSHYTFQQLGQPIVKTLLSPTNTRRLNSYLGGTHAELILVTLKLYNALSSFAGGREKKGVMEAFGWELKSLPKLLNMRRKASHDGPDALRKPDIRTLYILFILSFFSPDTPTQVKATFIEQHRDVFFSIFKGLIQDSYIVVRKILEVCWVGLWADPKLKRTSKINLFNETTISHVLKLYDRTAAEPESDTDTDADQIPADLVHHFLLAICTHPGSGICFKDRGWYPREADIDNDEDLGKGKGRIYNRILSNVLKTLKVNEDIRQQELALKIMAACPELVAGYWSNASLTLEPRLSSKWIANIAFFGSVLSLPVPSTSFYLKLPSSTPTDLNGMYYPTPPPLSTIIENILPSVSTKALFTKGIQPSSTSSGLVQHCAALALCKCLRKYEDVVQAFLEVEEALGEGEDGQWVRRRRELEREVRKRVPDFMVVVAFSQATTAPTTSGATAPAAQNSNSDTDSKTNNPTRAALLAESAQRLLWMYQRCLPLVVAEARFDVGKLLHGFIASPEKESEGATEQEEELKPADHLRVVQQLHVLRTLTDSEQFGWAGKSGTGSTSQTYLSILLSAYINTAIPAIHSAISNLLQRILASSILFQDDPSEPYLWLICLPRSWRERGTESPDGAALTDEGEGVVTFLDDCVQRCTKAPYRYLEDLHSLDQPVDVSLQPNQVVLDKERIEPLPSPLLMTVLEQLEIKVVKKILSSSDILALATFVRKLLFRLASKQQQEGLGFLRKVVVKVDKMLDVEKLDAIRFPVISGAIRQEVDLMHDVLSCGAPQLDVSVVSPDNVKGFLFEVAQTTIPPTQEERRTTAQQLVDWLRLLSDPIGPTELTRLALVLTQLHPPSLALVVEHLSPATETIWRGLDISTRYSALRQHLSFDFLFLHASEIQLADPLCREIISDAALGAEPGLVEAKRAIFLIGHRLGSETFEAKGYLFLLLASILQRATKTLSHIEVAVLKETLFIQSRVVKSFLKSEALRDEIRRALHQLVNNSLDPKVMEDRELLTDICAHWLEVLTAGVVNEAQILHASSWIQYFQREQIIRLLDSVFVDISTPLTSTMLSILDNILTAVRNFTTEFDVSQELIQRLPKLVALYSQTPSIVLEDLIAITVQSSLPAYYDGCLCAENLEDTSIMDITSQAELRWTQRRDQWPADLSVQSLLKQESWSGSTVTAISGLVYRGHMTKDTIIPWLSSELCAALSLEHFIVVFHAFLDITSSQGKEVMDDDILAVHFSRILNAIVEKTLSPSVLSLGTNCISLMTCMMSSRTPQFIATLARTIQSFSVSDINISLLSIGRRLHAQLPQQSEVLLTELVNHGLQWTTRHFAEEEDSEFDTPINDLAFLALSASGIKPHLVETVVGVAVQHRLNHPSAMDLISALLSRVHLKPVVVNRHLQSILQHPSFFKYAGNASADGVSTREAIVRLLYTLFNLHPSNTCQATHVEPLVRIYRGTLSKADGQILSIFRLFETERKISISSLLCRWSPTPNLLSVTALEAIHGLDAILVLRTCLSFPPWRNLEDLSTEKATSHETQLYDPVFLILLFAQMLAENPPESTFAWIEVFRTNIASMLIKTLSSKHGAMRDVALCQLAGLWQYLENADLQERPHILHILTLLKDLFPTPTEGPPRRLPSYTTLLLLHAMRGIFYPSNFIYPITARFLLQRPELDVNDVPMLYNMLYSSSDHWKKERGWIIRFLSDGMMSSDDWRILKGRHTWDLLASLFQSSQEDRALCMGILEVLANLSCNSQATMSLVLKSGLLSWIEIQLMTSKETHTVEWIKILCNIMAVVDPGKLETSTNGEWRKVICRCLLILVENPKSSHTIAAFAYAIQAALQLSLLPGPQVADVPLLMYRLAECMRIFEISTTVPPGSVRFTPKKPSYCLYRAHEIHQTSPHEDMLQVWGAAVDALWRISMTLDEAAISWDVITSRVLVWRAITRVQDGVGEWVRLQVISNLAVG